MIFINEKCVNTEGLQQFRAANIVGNSSPNTYNITNAVVGGRSLPKHVVQETTNRQPHGAPATKGRVSPSRVQTPSATAPLRTPTSLIGSLNPTDGWSMPYVHTAEAIDPGMRFISTNCWMATRTHGIGRCPRELVGIPEPRSQS